MSFIFFAFKFLFCQEAEGMTGISCKNKQISLNLEEEGAGLYGRTPDLNNTLPVHHINLLIQPKPEPFSIISAEPLSTQWYRWILYYIIKKKMYCNFLL